MSAHLRWPATAGEVLEPLRNAVLRQLQGAFGGGPPDLSEYATPAGDPGLFGPGSVPWRVHADLPSMLVGGFAALMLQSLHPLAMAGVSQHSDYRTDPFGRLGRTARFVAGTTFGPMRLVDELVAQVRAIHRHVHGIAPDGRPYAAGDPHLLAFVHTAEVRCFLRAYQRHSLRPLVGAERDEYLAQMAVVPRLLGAVAVPENVAELRAYLRDIRPELGATPEARDAMAFLRNTPASDTPAALAVHRLVIDASAELLPGWARRMLRIGHVPGAAVSAPVAASGFGAVLRWAVGDSLIARVSAERVAAGQPSSTC